MLQVCSRSSDSVTVFLTHSLVRPKFYWTKLALPVQGCLSSLAFQSILQFARLSWTTCTQTHCNYKGGGFLLREQLLLHVVGADVCTYMDNFLSSIGDSNRSGTYHM